MKFNYNTEKKKYIRKWEVLEKELSLLSGILFTVLACLWGLVGLRN